MSGEEEKSRPPREAFRAPRSSKSLPDLIGAFAFGGKFSSRNCLLHGPFSVPMRYCKGKDPDLEPQGPAWGQGRPGPRGSTRGRDSALGSGAASFSATSSQVGRPGDRTGGRGVCFGDPVWEGAVRPGWLCVILQPSRTCTPSPSLLGKGEPRHRWAGAVVSTRGAPKNPPTQLLIQTPRGPGRSGACLGNQAWKRDLLPVLEPSQTLTAPTPRCSLSSLTSAELSTGAGPYFRHRLTAEFQLGYFLAVCP